MLTLLTHTITVATVGTSIDHLLAGLGGNRIYRWAASDGSWWDIDLTWAEIDGRAECVGLAIRSYATGTELDGLKGIEGQPLLPIRSHILRGRLIELIEQERQRRARPNPQMWRGIGTAEDQRVNAERQAVKAAKFAKGRGRKLVGADGRVLPPADALAEVADIYRQAYAAGLSPTRAVAEALSLSPSAAAKRVGRARAAGLLPPTTRGRARVVAPEADGTVGD